MHFNCLIQSVKEVRAKKGNFQVVVVVFFLGVSQVTSHVSINIDLSKKDDITVLKHELSYGSSFYVSF